MIFYSKIVLMELGIRTIWSEAGLVEHWSLLGWSYLLFLHHLKFSSSHVNPQLTNSMDETAEKQLKTYTTREGHFIQKTYSAWRVRYFVSVQWNFSGSLWPSLSWRRVRARPSSVTPPVFILRQWHCGPPPRHYDAKFNSIGHVRSTRCRWAPGVRVVASFKCFNTKNNSVRIERK